MKVVESSINLDLPPQEVLDVFIRQEHLKAWWGVDRSLIELKRGGLYSLVWQNRESCVEYVSTGVIEEYLPACQLKIRNLVYINPQRPILGPMELLVMTTPNDDRTTQLTVIQSGYQQGPDWDWFYEAVLQAWPDVLIQVKKYLQAISVH
ncbi:MAG TPA: SRPBCC domain-containing protein [Cyclobacteriaceae bacterium]|nr:SRPBCC domain-containing protein [Cyclobacteriaceae bacterium]